GRRQGLWPWSPTRPQPYPHTWRAGTPALDGGSLNCISETNRSREEQHDDEAKEFSEGSWVGRYACGDRRAFRAGDPVGYKQELRAEWRHQDRPAVLALRGSGGGRADPA